MTRVCPDCRGTGKRGRQPCGTCNPTSGLLDGAAAALRRAGNAATGKRVTVNVDTGGRRTTTTRNGWLGVETTRTTGRKPAKKAAPKKRR